MAPKLIDIAKDSGLSTAVVSSVLSGGSASVRFSRATRQKVFRSASRLGYKPPVNDTLGLLYCVGPNRSKDRNWVGYLGPMLSELQNRCNENDQLLTMYCYSAEELSDALDLCKLPQILRRRKTDGLVVMGTVTPELIEGIHEIKMPYVMMNVNEADSHAENAVFFDDVFTGTAATNYLIDRGRKNILHVSVDGNDHYSVTQRINGYRQALQSRGLGEGRVIYHTPTKSAELQQRIKDILTSPDRPDAIFAYTYTIAWTCYRVFIDLKLTFKDVALITVTFENKESSEYLGINSVKLPAAEMVSQAYAKLMRNIDSGEIMPTVSLRGCIDDQGSVPDVS